MTIPNSLKQNEDAARQEMIVCNNKCNLIREMHQKHINLLPYTFLFCIQQFLNFWHFMCSVSAILTWRIYRLPDMQLLAKQQIKLICMHIEIPYRYLISSGWMKKWKSYVGYDCCSHNYIPQEEKPEPLQTRSMIGMIVLWLIGLCRKHTHPCLFWSQAATRFM